MPIFAGSIPNFDDLQKEANAARARVLLTDTSIGLTFATIAAKADAGSEKQLRNQANALRAYDSIVSHRAGTMFSTPEAQQYFDSRVAELKGTLEVLGESFYFAATGWTGTPTARPAGFQAFSHQELATVANRLSLGPAVRRRGGSVVRLILICSACACSTPSRGTRITRSPIRPSGGRTLAVDSASTQAEGNGHGVHLGNGSKISHGFSALVEPRYRLQV